ncbi:MAG: AraC family transcriptional regulator [Acidobacteriota bacterium]
MDPLSDLLRVVRLDGAYFYAVEAVSPWSVETAAARELTPRIMPAAEHLISYHIVTEGRCFGGVVGADPVELVRGDVIVFPQGDAHIMSSERSRQPGAGVHRVSTTRFRETVVLGSAAAPGATHTTFVCGFLGCDRRPFNPLLAALPRQLHVRGLSHEAFGGLTRELVEDSRVGKAGAEGVLTRLAELMFIAVLRRYLEGLPAEHTGWLAGLRDELVGRVLTLLHGRPGHPWTIDELARAAASSRSNVAKRFTELVGQPPMQYLTAWRMQVAANLLRQSGAKVAAIAGAVGYDSEAAFSRAFKKATGVAPGAWRDVRRGARARRSSKRWRR